MDLRKAYSKSPINTWKYQIDDYQENDELEDEYKKLIIGSLYRLQKHLGNGFLKNQSAQHPLVFYIHNKAKHSSDWLIWLVETIDHFYESDRSSFDHLIAKIRDSKRVKHEGIPFIDISSSLLKSGFSVQIEPEVDFTRKNPDMSIINPTNGEKIYIEISKVNESKERKIASRLHHSLSMYFFRFVDKLIYGLRINHIPESEGQANILIKKIEQEVAENREKDNVLVTDNSSYELILSKKDKEEEILKILHDRALEPNRIFMDLSFDDTPRIRGNKIKLKVKQLPKNKPGLLYFPVEAMYQLTTNPIEVSRSLKSVVNQFPNLIGVVLYSSIWSLNKQELFIPFENSIYSQMSTFEINTKKILFVGNDDFQMELSEDTGKKIADSFKTH